MKVIFVGGLKDIDRKTIIDLALQRAGRKREYKVVDFNLFEEISEEIEATSDLEMVKVILSKFQENVEKSLISEIKQNTGGLIISGFLTFKTRHGYLRSLTEEFFRSFKPDAIILLELHPDSFGKMDIDKIEHQHINRHFGLTYASIIGSVFKVIRFREKKMLDAVEALSNIIK